MSLLWDWQIEKRWQVFGKDVAREVASTILKNKHYSSAIWFCANLSLLRLRASLRIIRQMWKYPHFWYLVTIMPFKQPKKILIHPMKRILKPVIRGIFKRFPRLTSASPRLVRLYTLVNR